MFWVEYIFKGFVLDREFYMLFGSFLVFIWKMNLYLVFEVFVFWVNLS